MAAFFALCCLAGSAVTSDIRYLSADEPRGEWKVVLPRTHETE